MADKDKNNQQNLGCLEEDDEFEEFPVEGMYTITLSKCLRSLHGQQGIRAPVFNID